MGDGLLDEFFRSFIYIKEGIFHVNSKMVGRKDINTQNKAESKLDDLI